MSRDPHPRDLPARPAARPALLALVTLTSGCLAYRPIIVDRKTDFEVQVLGGFERWHERPSAAAGLALARVQAATSPDARQLLQAVLDSELLHEATRRAKQAGLVGEGRQGLLVLLAPPTTEAERERLAHLVSAENAWRLRLMQAVLASDAALGARDLPEVQRIFHRLQRATAEAGVLVEGADGRWQPTALRRAPTTPSR